MAENESLDLVDSRRWQTAGKAVRQGKSSQEVARTVERCLFGGWRAALKELGKKEVPLKDFLAARHDPNRLQELVKKAKGHDYAVLLRDTALAEQGVSDEAYLESCLWAVWEKMRDQIAQAVVPCDQWPAYPDLQTHLYEVREQIAAEVQGLAAKLAEAPARLPPRRPARDKSGEQDSTVAMLGESLLGMFPK
jgi:hypothetical protein